MKNVAVLTEDGVFALFFRPHTGGFDSSRLESPHPREFAIQGQKNANARGSARRGVGGGGLGGGGIDWCITNKVFQFCNLFLPFVHTVPDS